MPPNFYFAIGARPARSDLAIALAVGQTDFLIPIGATLTDTLRDMPGVRVVLDSAAWPPGNPDRPTLEAYAEELLTWQVADGTWGNLAWAAAYDHIGDPARTQADYHRLLGLLEAAGTASCPIVPITHYPSDALTTITLDLWQGAAGARFDLVDGNGGLTRPCYGIGGMVQALHPTRPRTEFEDADQWYTELVRDLEWEVECEGLDSALAGIHLFGIGRPSFVLRSPLVASFDSSGPAQQAKFGWAKIAPSYTPAYGLSPEKLQTSRAARLAYWLMDYRARMGLNYRRIEADTLPDDAAPPSHIQLSMLELLTT